MTIRRVTSPDVPEPPPERWSNCLVSDGIAYVSGMTARGTDPKVLAGMDARDGGFTNFVIDPTQV